MAPLGRFVAVIGATVLGISGLVGAPLVASVGNDAHAASEGLITGTVREQGGGPVHPDAALTVYAILPDKDIWVDVGIVDNATGAYTLTVPAGRYRFSVKEQYDQYVEEFYNDKASLATADVVAVSPGTANPKLDFAMTRAGWISGTVAPVGGGRFDDDTSVRVEFFDSTGRRWPSAWVDNGTGRYVRDGLPPGRYRVGFKASGGQYASEYFDDSPSREAAAPVPVSAGTETGGIDARLSPASHISGTVSPEAGGRLDPRSDVLVIAHDGAGRQVAQVEADPMTGAYAFEDLRAGSYRLWFADFNSVYAWEYYDDKTALAAADRVVTSPTASLTGIDARLRVGPNPLPSPTRSPVPPSPRPSSATPTPSGRPTVPPKEEQPRRAVQSVRSPKPVLKRGKVARLAKVTRSGIPVRWTSATRKTCKISRKGVKAGNRRGTCRLVARAAGNDRLLGLKVSFRIRIT